MVAKFAIWGAMGFGVGFGVMEILPVLWVFFVVGGVGGLFLGVPFGGVRKVVSLVFLMSAGFGVGGTMGFFILMTVWDPIGFSLAGVTGGALGGAAVGVFLRNFKGLFLLSLSGALAFGVGMWIFDTLLRATYDMTSGSSLPWWAFVILHAIGGIVGGGLLGASIGLLQTSVANTNQSLSVSE